MTNYKHYLNILYLLFFYTGCGFIYYQQIESNNKITHQHQAPKWFHSQEFFNNTKPFEIIGFGDGCSFEEARIKARNEIAKQIKIMLKSNFSINERLKSNDDKEEEKYSLNIQNKVSEQTSVELDDVIQINSERINNHTYVALKYIHLPTAKKIKYKLDLNGKFNCNNKTNNIEFLSKTPLMKKLKRVFGCEPKIEIVYKNSNWYISVEQILTRIPAFEFIDLWTGYSDHAIKIKTSKNFLNKGDIFQIKIDIFKQGYLSLFDIYHTGQTVILINNQKINKSQQLIYPDHKRFEGLEADIPLNQNHSKDLYISMLCSNFKDFSRYEPIDEKYLATNQSFYFGHLLEDMKGCHIASEIVHIRH